MTFINFSLKWKLIIWLSLIGFVTSVGIHFTLIMLGSSNISYTMQQYPILKWQKSNIEAPLKKRANNQKLINNYLTSLIQKSPHQVSLQNNPFTKITISNIAFVDINSRLVFKTKDTPLLQGDVGSQIIIQSRDDLADALIGHNNSGIEPLGKNEYLVINRVLNNKEGIIGATISWQSWQYKPNQAPLFYIPLLQIVKISIFNTLASFFWIFPSTLILGWLVARVITERFRHLYQTIEDWGAGNLTSRIVTSGSDEISVSFKRLNQMAEKLEKHKKEIAQLVSIEERQQLAAELHDTVKQQLFASNLQLSSTAQQIEIDFSGAKESLSKAIKLNQTASKQINELIFALSPIQIGDSLKDALEKAFSYWLQHNRVNFSSTLNLDAALTEIQQQIIFRSIMEALQNVSKHSNACEVNVEVSQNNTLIKWLVEDNGRVDSNNKLQFGQGLNLMLKRIESLGGKLMIETNNGFKLSGSLPI